MSTVQENVKNPDTWLRGLFIVVFGIIFYALYLIIWLLVVFQFVVKVVTGNINTNLLGFSDSLTQYAYQVLRYMTFQSEERPWPFAPWPESTPSIPPPPSA
jgi:hypothetical protein